MKPRIKRGRHRPSYFCRLPKKGDLAVVMAQSRGRRFDPALILGVAARCGFDLPSVITCRPLRRGEPFPTTFWLTCPHLVKLCGSLESEGAVGELNMMAQRDQSGWSAYNLLHAQIRISLTEPPAAEFLRKFRRSQWDVLRKGGVGGIDYRASLKGGAKCLHLQTASWLALGFHPAAACLEDSLSPLYCKNPPEECLKNTPRIKEALHVEG